MQTIGGLYADRLLRRHYPWPEGRYKWEPPQIGPAWRADRLWQSALSPLIAGGEIALAGAAGGGVRIGQVRTNAANVVLAWGLTQTPPWLPRFSRQAAFLILGAFAVMADQVFDAALYTGLTEGASSDPPDRVEAQATWRARA